MNPKVSINIAMKIFELEMDPNRTDYEIRNYHKLDKLLEGLCDLVDKGQHANKNYGMVAAGILSLKYPYMARLNRPGDGGRIHAEQAVITDFINKYGEIPEGTVMLTTLSPCNKHMDERDGPSCASLCDKYGIKKVYCGFIDPTQEKGEEDHRHYNLMETQNADIRARCQEYAESFLGNVSEGLHFGSLVWPPHVNHYNKETHKRVEPVPSAVKPTPTSNPAVKLDISHGAGEELKSSPEYRRSRKEQDQIKKYQDRVKAGYDPRDEDDEHDYMDVPEAYDGPPMKFLRPGELTGSYTDQQLKAMGFKLSSKGHWYTPMHNWQRLTSTGQIKENFDHGVAEGLNEFAISGDGSGDDHSLFHYAKMWYRGDYDTQQQVEQILARMGWEIGEVEDEEGGVFVVQQGDINGDSYLHFPVDDLSEGVAENFADGKNPGRKGLSKRMGVNTKASVSSLRKTAKHSSGEKARMAHWLANMKAGRNK
jgi:pyrimidine deaminase RibD-like protein